MKSKMKIQVPEWLRCEDTSLQLFAAYQEASLTIAMVRAFVLYKIYGRLTQANFVAIYSRLNLPLIKMSVALIGINN